MTEQEQEAKNKRIAALTTAGIQALVLLLLFVIVAWRAPDPPLPEYGIELNFGMDTEGSGDIQPETPVGNEGNEPEEAATAQPEEVKPEETKEPVQAEAKPADTKPAEEQIVSKIESPVVLKEKEKKEPEKPVEKPVEKIEEKKVEKKPEVKPKVDDNAVFKPKNNQQQSEADKEGAKEGKPGNQGDDTDKTGDKGNPEGKLDAKALYGKPGGGSGGVSMSGFNGFDWPTVNAPTMPEEAYGVYEFLVKVDEEGNVISVTAEKRGLSLEAERKLKEMIQRLEFIPKGSNPSPSEGRITFRVVSK